MIGIFGFSWRVRFKDICFFVDMMGVLMIYIKYGSWFFYWFLFMFWGSCVVLFVILYSDLGIFCLI